MPVPGRAKEPVSITTARASLTEDVAARQRRYLITMAVRTVCFVAAVLFTDGWLQWVCIVGAVVLPYVAVVMANGGRENDVRTPAPFVPDVRRALGPGPAEPPAPRGPGA